MESYIEIGKFSGPTSGSTDGSSVPLKLAIQRNTVAWGRLNSFLLSENADCPIQAKEPPRTVLGRSNPLLNGRTARCSPHNLDPYGRGACDVCPGLPSLKVVGIVSVRFTNSPITKDQV